MADMDDVERMQRVIALNHVRAKGDAPTQEFVDVLLKDREVAQKQVRSLSTEVGALQGDIVDVHRSGLSPAMRNLAGLGFAVLALVSGLAALTLWFGGLVPLTHAMRVSVGAEPAPVRPDPSWVTPIISFTSVGPPEIITAVTNRFKVMPTAIDTGIGTHLRLRYVDGPYSRLEGEAQRAQALAIARFVYRLPQRPKGTDTITVRVERPMRMVGDVGVTTEQIFLPAELNGR